MVLNERLRLVATSLILLLLFAVFLNLNVEKQIVPRYVPQPHSSSVCGNGAVEPGEQCENDVDCQNLYPGREHFCGFDCVCATTTTTTTTLVGRL